MSIPPFLESITAQLLACAVAGVALAVACGLIILLGKAWRHAWGWIDDSEPGRNPVLELIARLRGWTTFETKGTTSTYLWWKDKKGETRTDPFIDLFLVVLFTPLSIYLVFKLYALALFVVSLLAIAFVARFARRHKKLFDKHIKDPEAHK